MDISDRKMHLGLCLWLGCVLPDDKQQKVSCSNVLKGVDDLLIPSFISDKTEVGSKNVGNMVSNQILTVGGRGLQ